MLCCWRHTSVRYHGRSYVAQLRVRAGFFQLLLQFLVFPFGVTQVRFSFGPAFFICLVRGGRCLRDGVRGDGVRLRDDLWGWRGVVLPVGVTVVWSPFVSEVVSPLWPMA